MPRKKKQEAPQAEPQGVEDYLRDILATSRETRIEDATERGRSC